MDEMRFEETMTTYYRRFFPFKLMHRWLNYGGSDKHYFTNREFSFTLRGDIYVRYQSFSDANDFEQTIVDRCPEKIDIGAVFSTKPKDHKTVMKAAFQPLEKELVFDIDMTDYDDVRYCCSGTDVCSKCWTVMRIAVKVIDAILREDFGFRHLMWVFSGRRGVHCWVADSAARRLTVSERETIVDYAELRERGGADRGRIALRAGSLSKDYPAVARAIKICRAAFERFAIDQDFLGGVDRTARFAARYPPARRTHIEKVFETTSDLKTSRERFEALDTFVSELTGDNWSPFQANGRSSTGTDSHSSSKHQQARGGSKYQSYRPDAKSASVQFARFWDELALETLYPRLDANVSRQLNHLLKAPFCVHPKTGRVCVPFDAENVDSFEPHRDVPTVTQLITEVNELDAAARNKLQAQSQSQSQSTEGDRNASLNQSGIGSTLNDSDSEPENDAEKLAAVKRLPKATQRELFKKSSLRDAIRVFNNFVNALSAEEVRSQVRSDKGAVEF